MNRTANQLYKSADGLAVFSQHHESGWLHDLPHQDYEPE